MLTLGDGVESVESQCSALCRANVNILTAPLIQEQRTSKLIRSLEKILRKPDWTLIQEAA